MSVFFCVSNITDAHTHTHTQEDIRFLRQLFKELMDEGTPVDRYRDLVELLREICNFSLALQLKERTLFYNTLCSFGFMKAAEGMLVRPLVIGFICIGVCVYVCVWGGGLVGCGCVCVGGGVCMCGCTLLK